MRTPKCLVGLYERKVICNHFLQNATILKKHIAYVSKITHIHT